MTNQFPSREIVEKVRKEYPTGTRVRLILINDPYTRLVSDDKGTVDSVDGIGTVHVNWDNGSRLGVACGEDLIEKI